MKSWIFEKLMDNYHVSDHIIFSVYFWGQAMVPMLVIFAERLLIFMEKLLIFVEQ